MVYFEAQDLEELEPFLKQLPDHRWSSIIWVARMWPRGSIIRIFVRFLRLMAENENIWSKVTCPERLTKAMGPPYDDVVPFYRRHR